MCLTKQKTKNKQQRELMFFFFLKKVEEQFALNGNLLNFLKIFLFIYIFSRCIQYKKK